jgi:hypothetical protein
VTITSAFVRTYSSADTDVSYFLGNTANPLALAGVGIGSLGGLGFGVEQVDNSNAGSNTVTINAGPFNSLLLGAQRGETNDAFKIRTLTINYTPTVVPEPMTLSLLGTGLLGLGVFAWRRRRA